MRFLATVSPGLEEELAEEVAGFLPETCVEGPGAISFDGEWDAAARVLVRSRLAGRVLLALGRFSARTGPMLYDQVRRIAWQRYLTPSRSMAIFAHGSMRDTDYNRDWATLRIKDAICDELRKRVGDRPNVDRHDADIRIEAFFEKGRCELSLDLTGAPLHQRSYREQSSEAPLRENRAAALLRFAGYDGSQALVDPFCGGGTLAIEAALIASGRAPGLLRPADGTRLWKCFPEARPAIDAERRSAEAVPENSHRQPILASDLDEEAVAATRANAERAGVADRIEVRHADALELAVENTLIVCNPPWGRRLEHGVEAREGLGAFTRQVKHHCRTSTLALVLPQGPIQHAVGLKPARKLSLGLGGGEARFLRYDIY